MIPEQIEKEIQEKVRLTLKGINYPGWVPQIMQTLLCEDYEDKVYTAQQALGRGLYLRRMAASDPSLVPLIREECKKYIADIPLITPKQ